LLGLLYRIRKTKWAGYLFPLPACLLAWAGHLVLSHAGAANLPYLPFFAALVFSTALGGIGPGLLCIIIAELMAHGVFTDPSGALPAHNRPTTLAVIAAGLFITWLVDYGTTAAIRLHKASRALRAVNETLEARIRERTAALLEAEENLRQAQKMEAVGQLTGGIAHDFNNLLTAIMGSLERLEARLPDATPDELAPYIAAARDASSRAANLTNRLLNFSRRQPLSPCATDINGLVASMEELISRTISPAIRLNTSPEPDLHATMVDPNQLEHALLNLCINASDAMPDGGQLSIRTGNVSLSAAQASPFGLKPGEYVTLTVADTGTGMAPDVLKRVFEPFFTTKAPGKGTGLGLSMIYGFARQSGGHTEISSRPGAGTSVTLYLPRHCGQADQPLSLPAPARPEATRLGETILLVDDEPSIRLLAAEVLEEQGYIVHQAANAEGALRILREGPAIDILVADLGLPGLNGRQLAETGRALRPKMKILFITGYGEPTSRPAAPPISAHTLLSKPFPMTALAARVQEMLSA
jgi:signal transduction histidine kinase